jgi:hypothetical protein
MKWKYVILILIAIQGIWACHNRSSQSANTSFPVDSTKKKNLGKIEFTKEMHNFGTVKEGEIVGYSFKFKNVGTTPLRLTKVEPTCGCLNVLYSQEEIAPKATSVIEVVFHSDGEWGNQVKSVNIQTSDGETKTLVIGAYVENKNFNTDINN